MTQEVLSFKYEEDKNNAGMTALGGLPVYLDLLSYSVNRGFAEYVLALSDYVGKLPENVSFKEIAPTLCASVTTYKGLK